MLASSEHPAAPPRALITGVSGGIGLALGQQLLEQGYQVFGVSRTVPAALIRHENFVHACIDLAHTESSTKLLADWLVREHKLTTINRVFLNAGQFSQRIAACSDVPLPEIQDLMQVNVWANKNVLDVLLNANIAIDSCVVSSSIAGVRARAGNSGYAISKAALNMMIRLYALEHPLVYFAVLGLCNVHTSLSRRIGALPLEGDFDEIEQLRIRGRRPGYLVTPHQRASHILRLLDGALKQHLPSGEFQEIRLLLEELESHASMPPDTAQAIA